jgi:hypothetical protein
VGHVVCMGGMRNACNILVGRPEGKIPARGMSRSGWADNVK